MGENLIAKNIPLESKDTLIGDASKLIDSRVGLLKVCPICDQDPSFLYTFKVLSPGNKTDTILPESSKSTKVKRFRPWSTASTLKLSVQVLLFEYS